MRKTLIIIFWLIQLNLLMWLAVANMFDFKSIAAIIGLVIGMVLEHVAVRHLRPEIGLLPKK